MKEWKKGIMALCMVCFGVLIMEQGGRTAEAAMGKVAESDVAGEAEVSDSQGAGTDEQAKEKKDEGDGDEAAGNETAGDEETGKGAADEGTGVTSLVIDNRHLYTGMDKTYSKGYVPRVKNGKAVIVLPLLAKQKLSGDKITVTLNLGEAEPLPFVRKNYEKEVKLSTHKTGKQNQKRECYLVTYSLDLKKERYNGSYPVVLSVSGEDEAGNEIHQDFTVYVTITDGKAAEGTADGDSGGDAGGEEPSFAPKVKVDSYAFSKENVQSGDSFRADITLVNTSKTDMVKNMMVTAAPGEQMELLSKSDSIYVEEVAAGKTCVVSYELKASAAILPGQYNIPITLDYADQKGTVYTVQGNVKVTVEQLVKVEIDPVTVPKEIQLGETVELQAQVMNLGRGKIYNVRAVVEAEGLESVGTAFIGDIEAGNAMPGSTEITATGLSGNSLYGKTGGKITFYYEDEAGNEMWQEQTFETSILSLQSEKKEEDDDTGQWWLIMAVIVMILSGTGVFFAVKRTGRFSVDRAAE